MTYVVLYLASGLTTQQSVSPITILLVVTHRGQRGQRERHEGQYREVELARFDEHVAAGGPAVPKPGRRSWATRSTELPCLVLITKRFQQPWHSSEQAYLEGRLWYLWMSLASIRRARHG